MLNSCLQAWKADSYSGVHVTGWESLTLFPVRQSCNGVWNLAGYAKKLTLFFNGCESRKVRYCFHLLLQRSATYCWGVNSKKMNFMLTKVTLGWIDDDAVWWECWCSSISFKTMSMSLMYGNKKVIKAIHFVDKALKYFCGISKSCKEIRKDRMTSFFAICLMILTLFRGILSGWRGNLSQVIRIWLPWVRLNFPAICDGGINSWNLSTRDANSSISIFDCDIRSTFVESGNLLSHFVRKMLSGTILSKFLMA